MIDKILPFAPVSVNGLVVDYDAADKSFAVRPDVRGWLRTRPHHLSYKRTDHDPYGFEIYLNFHQHADMLLFKLTWGGKPQ